MNVKEKSRLYRDLAKLLGANFPMDKGVAMLLGQQPKAERRQYLEGIQQGFARGMSFAESLRAYHTGPASALELSLIESGERSGRLAESFLHLAHYFETWHKGIAAARGAMIYPLILLHLGVILPEVARLFMLSVLGKETHPGPAIIWRLIIFWAILLVINVTWKRLSSVATKSEFVDRLLNFLPLIGALRKHWALARFCQVFHSGLLASMRMSQCIRMAGDASQSGTLYQGSVITADNLDHGRTLTESIELSNRFPRHFVTSIATAEAAGGLDTEMSRWAAAETDFAAETQKGVAELYPKALYFAIVGYVGYRVVTVFADYFGSLKDLTN